MMKVKDVVKTLQSYRQDIDVKVIAHNQAYDFTICAGGGSDGGEDYDEVSFYVDSLCESEKLQENA